jgi:predicted nucleic acid-binding protein
LSIISNTTVISNFARIEQLGVLQALYGSIHLSVQVYDEIQQGLEEGYAFFAGLDQFVYPFVADGWIKLVSMRDHDELLFFGELPRGLHSGEASCIAIARYRNWTLLTDDQAARTCALGLGIRVSGTLGCLLLAAERELCTEKQANAYLKQMIHQGYRSPVHDLAVLH